jgi:signal transduction histidine kinase
MSIRSRLVLLILSVLVPAILASLAGMAHVVKEREASLEQSLLEMSRALALVVDREIGRRKSFLTLLAATSGDPQDRQAFEKLLATAAEASNSTLFSYNGAGQVDLNTSGGDIEPWPIALDGVAGSTDFRVSDVFTNSQGVLSFAITKSIPVGGEVRHLAMVSPISDLQTIFADLDLPPTWTSAILDRNAIIVARNRDPQIHAGKSVTPDVVARVGLEDKGFLSSVTRDGIRVLAAFNRAPGTGWTFIVGVSEAEVNKSTAEALRILAILAVLLLSAAVLLSIRFGRTIAAPLRSLTGQAAALGRGEPVSELATGLRETDLVSASLVAASGQIRSAKDNLQQRVAEAVAVSERSQAALLQSQKLEALGRLTGGIAHDFNNLLQTLSTGLHIADHLSANAEAKGAITSCKRAVGRAAKLTRQLMAFGRNQISEACRVDVGNQLLSMEDLLRGALRNNIQLSFEIPEELWPVHVDPLQFELAILNLAINARDAMPGTGSVRIAAENREIADGEISGLAAACYVRLNFEDTGEGMPPEVVEKALDPFFTTKPAGQGSGLGLAQIYGFVTQVGGRVTIQSQLGVGTCVTLFLPRSMAEADVEPGKPPAPTADSGRDAVVLVVEDDLLVRNVLTPALRAHRFQVITAGDAAEALEILKSQPVDVVFSDIVMPGSMNGVGLAKIILEDHPSIQVMLATGYSEDAAVPPGIRVIPKPYEIGAVVEALRGCLARPKQDS